MFEIYAQISPQTVWHMLKLVYSIFFLCVFSLSAIGQVSIRVGTSSPDKSQSSTFIATADFEPVFRHQPIKSLEAWQKSVSAIRSDFQSYVYGSFPAAPNKVSWQKTGETFEQQVTVRQYEISFEPGGHVRVEVLLPFDTLSPKPVFLTQWNHRTWALLAVQRGYIGVVYAGADEADDSKNLDQLFPKATFATLAKRAWLAGRVVDFLHQLSWVDTSKIALTGHSRNGKQSLLAAAFDNRIKAVASSSAGTGGEVPWRFAHPFFNHESLQQITNKFPHWFAPRLKDFAERETELPVDQHLLLGLLAPRPVYILSAWHEAQACNLGAWHAVETAKTVYRWHGKPENIMLHLREGEHGTDAEDIEKIIDWFDIAFGRGNVGAPQSFEWRFPHTPKALKSDFEPLMLGKAPPLTENSRMPRKLNKYAKGHFMQSFMENTMEKISGVCSFQIAPYNELGDYLYAHLYVPCSNKDAVISTVNQKFPIVVWLHPAAYNTGFRKDLHGQIAHFLENGFAVLCYDQIGFGTRFEEGQQFYRRFPEWTLLGKMVHDARSAFSLARQLDLVDSNQVILAGSGLGSLVGSVVLGQQKAVLKAVFYDPLFVHLGSSDQSIGQFLSQICGLFPASVDFERSTLANWVQRAAALQPCMVVQPTHSGTTKPTYFFKEKKPSISLRLTSAYEGMYKATSQDVIQFIKQVD